MAVETSHSATDPASLNHFRRPGVARSTQGSPLRSFRVILFIAAFLPYIKTSPMGTDVQPHFMFLLFLYFLLHMAQTRSVPISYVSLSLSFFMFSFAVAAGSVVTAAALMSIPPTIAVTRRFPEREIVIAAKCATMIYIIGVPLEIIAPDFLNSVLPRFDGNSIRGFKSFATEPSYLGLAGVALTTVLLHFRQNIFWIALSSSVVIVSQSLTALAPLALILVFGMFRFNRLHYFLLTGTVLYFLFQFLASLEGTRIAFLLNTFLTYPELLLQDGSVSNRIARAVVPLKTAAEDFLIPHRFPEPWDLPVTYTFLSPWTDMYVERLSSFGIVLIYIFGIFSLPLFVGYIAQIRARPFLMIALFYFIFTLISMATPYASIIIALPLRDKRRMLFLKGGGRFLK